MSRTTTRATVAIQVLGRLTATVEPCWGDDAGVGQLALLVGPSLHRMFCTVWLFLSVIGTAS